MKIRSYESADRAAVLVLVPRLEVGRPEWRDEEAWMCAFHDWVAAALDAVEEPARTEHAGAVFVAEDGDGRVTGFVHVEPGKHFSGEPEAYIGELAVAANHARQGIGRALVRAASSWAREQGFERVALHAASGSPEALAFYRAVGFTSESVYLTASLSTG